MTCVACMAVIAEIFLVRHGHSSIVAGSAVDVMTFRAQLVLMHRALIPRRGNVEMRGIGGGSALGRIRRMTSPAIRVRLVVLHAGLDPLCRCIEMRGSKVMTGSARCREHRIDESG